MIKEKKTMKATRVTLGMAKGYSFKFLVVKL